VTTLKDLAKYLDLSPATVSRALNGFPEVGAKTRERVLKASRELSYTPNSSAKRLATGKSGVVGMIFRTTHNLMLDPHFTEFLAGLCTRLADSEIDLMFHIAPPGRQMAHYARYLAGEFVDGMIVSAPELNDQRIEALLERNFPFVVHGRSQDNPPYAFFDIDNDGAFARATRLLCELGHRRIALINGPKGMAFAEQRETAFLREMSVHGLKVPSPFVSHGEMSEDIAYQQACAMLDAQEFKAPTAFLCSSTLQALGVFRALGERGLEVGQDVSVVAHDDVLPHMRSEHFSTPLTVTRSAIRNASVHIADLIAKLIAGADPTSLQIIEPVDLIVRNSTAGAPLTGGEKW